MDKELRKTSKNDFTQGRIFSPLLRFSLPVLGAMVLQALYGAVDLYVVGKYGTAADVSAVATGAQLMHFFTGFIVGFTVGTTVLIGQSLGAGKDDEAGYAIGASIKIFGTMGLVLMTAVPLLADRLCALMNAPEAAFGKTVDYVTVCTLGALLIVSYNVLGSVFRGMGDSKTPLLAVSIACAANIFGDLYLVRELGMGAKGAAIATVAAQGLSVVLCVIIIARRGLPFAFGKKHLGRHPGTAGRIMSLGFPIAFQDLLVSFSFMVIISIVNSMGLVVSAGVGVAEKVCAFIMLAPSAFSQSLSSFVAQNIGAGRPDRARLALRYGILASLSLGVIMAYTAFFHGDLLTGIFTADPEVSAAAWDYLKAYAIDTLLVSFMFCFTGYYNGSGFTRFVMIQGLIGAFGVRIPFSWFMSRQVPVSVFKVGLATPASTAVQILLCVLYFRRALAENERRAQ